MTFSCAPSRPLGLLLAALALLAGPTAGAEEGKPDPAATRQYAVAAGLQSKKLYAQASSPMEGRIAPAAS